MKDTPDPRTPTSVDRAIGARIRARRNEIGISQEQLAQAIGVTFQQVQKYENGLNRVSASTLLRITAALDTHVAHLLPVKDIEERVKASFSDPELSAVLRLIAALNRDGIYALSVFAQALANDAKFKKGPD